MINVIGVGGFGISAELIEEVIQKILSDEGKSDHEINVLVVDDFKMQALNRQYHGVDSTTDVLSFPYQDPESSQDIGEFVVPENEPLPLGEIVISWPEVERQALNSGKKPEDILVGLLEHGMEHVMGRHHE